MGERGKERQWKKDKYRENVRDEGKRQGKEGIEM